MGVTVRMHYCMDQLAGWGLNNNESNPCSKCGKQESGTNDKDCCKDKHVNFKITEDQKITESSKLIAQQSVIIVPDQNIEFSANIPASAAPKKQLEDNPRVKHWVPRYILYCDYRI